MKRFGNLGVLAFLCLGLGIMSAANASASWPVNGNPVCVAIGDQKTPMIVSDGAGGVIITWYDCRGFNYDIYGQRFDSLGAVKWSADGVVICTALNEQLDPRLVSDGAGGAIITWYDGRGLDYDVYAQCVDSLGLVKWAADGVPVCTTAYFRERPQITSDQAGGAIIAWSDWRGVSANIYAQRIDSSGVVKWITDGVAVCTTSSDQQFPQLVTDGAGGAIIAWQDDRPGYFAIYAQRVDSLGEMRWNKDGVALCTAVNGQWNPQLVSDGAGGAIVAWEDERGGYFNVYAQRIDSSGVVKWSPDGIAMRAASGHQRFHQIVSDGAGGAIIAWQDGLGGNWDIYAQRMDSSGVAIWTANGTTVCSATAEQQHPQLASDESGGAIITWQDSRNGNYDVYTQRVDSSGVGKWIANGVPVCTVADSLPYPQLAYDKAGGGFVTWQDYRNGNYDIYVQRVGEDGVTDIVFASGSARVEHGHVILSWRIAVDVPGSSFVIKRSQVPYGDFVALDVLIDKEMGSVFSCADYSAIAGNTYWYKIVMVGPSIEESYGPIEVCVTAAPAAHMVYQSYPNPFNPLCTIRYELPAAARVSLQVFDLNGSVVRLLVDAWREPGVYGEVWDGKDVGGRPLPSGVYFYSIKAGDFAATRKMVLLR